MKSHLIYNTQLAIATVRRRSQLREGGGERDGGGGEGGGRGGGGGRVGGGEGEFFAIMLRMTKYTSMPNLVRLGQ